MKRIIFLIFIITISLNSYCQTFNGTYAIIIQSPVAGSCTASQNFPITVSGVGSNFRLQNIKFNIVHPRLDELELTLISPNGVQIPIISNAYGFNFNHTTISYNGTGQIENANSPYEGNYKGNFEPLNDINLNGVWNLRVCDKLNDSYYGWVESCSLTFFDASAELADYADLGTPSLSINYGGNAMVYGKVGEAGITDVNLFASNEMEAWVGYSTTNTNPKTWTNWIPATFNQNVGTNDEYKAYLNTLLPLGTYYYTMRYKLTNGVYYSYGGTNGGKWDGITHNNGVLTVTPAIPPPNDEPCNATPLTLNADYSCGTMVRGTTTLATVSAAVDGSFCCGSGSKDVWFSFVATATSHKFEVRNMTAFSLCQSIWTGPNCNSLTIVPTTCTQAYVSQPSFLTIGQTYYLRVCSSSSTQSSIVFDACVGVNPATPDIVTLEPPASATVTSPATFIVYGQIRQPGVTDVYTNGQAPGIKVWVGRSIYNTNPATDPYSTWSWSEATFNRQVGNNDEYKGQIIANYPGTYYYATRFQLAETGIYYYGGIDSNNNGGFWDGTTFKNGILTVNQPTPPVNDDCPNAIPLTIGTYFTEFPLTGTTQGATDTTNSSIDCNGIQQTINSGVFYTAVIPSSGQLVIELTSGSLIAYNGNSCGSLTQIACGSIIYNGRKRIHLYNQTPGTTVYLGVYNNNNFQISAFWEPSLETDHSDEPNNFSYSPNPVKDFLTLSNNYEIQKVEILNLVGQKISSTVFNSNEIKIDMSSLSKGIYLLNVFSVSSTKTIKIIKE